MCVHRDTGAQRAVKVLRKSHMDEEEKKMLFNEINILRGLVSNLSFAVHSSIWGLVTIHQYYLLLSPHPQISLFLFNYYLLSWLCQLHSYLVKKTIGGFETIEYISCNERGEIYETNLTNPLHLRSFRTIPTLSRCTSSSRTRKDTTL